MVPGFERALAATKAMMDEEVDRARELQRELTCADRQVSRHCCRTLCSGPMVPAVCTACAACALNPAQAWGTNHLLHCYVAVMPQSACSSLFTSGLQLV